MTVTDTPSESRAFEADVSRLLHLMVHSVYSDKDIFLRELISNAADACERLRYDAIATPSVEVAIEKLVQAVTCIVRCLAVVFQPVIKHRPAGLEVLVIESMVRSGIDD